MAPPEDKDTAGGNKDVDQQTEMTLTGDFHGQALQVPSPVPGVNCRFPAKQVPLGKLQHLWMLHALLSTRRVYWETMSLSLWRVRWRRIEGG